MQLVPSGYILVTSNASEYHGYAVRSTPNDILRHDYSTALSDICVPFETLRENQLLARTVDLAV